MVRIKALFFSLVTAVSATLAQAEQSFKSPDILVLGDSQLSFGAGPAFVDFLTMLEKNCGTSDTKSLSVGVIGVRSTSLGSWVARSGRAKGPICNVDPKWRVNAGSYGSLNQSQNQYVQIGQGTPYQFCKKGKSAFEAMFENGYYMPRLMILFFLGNSAERWANDADAAVRDVRETMQQLPADLPCIFMTTAPPYAKRVLDLRLAAQANLEKAFAAEGRHCTFIPGLTDVTIPANVGHKENFRRHKSGKIRDPYHPTEAAAVNFLKLNKRQLCQAILAKLSPKRLVAQ